MHLRKRLTGLKYAIKIEDNEVDELKPKVFNLVVSFNMFNWKENSTKEYGERETKKKNENERRMDYLDGLFGPNTLTSSQLAC